MATCLELRDNLGVTFPQIPGIFNGANVGLTISLGQVGVTCCTYTIPTFTPSIHIPMIGPLQTAINAVNALMDAASPTLDLALSIPKCPLD